MTNIIKYVQVNGKFTSDQSLIYNVSTLQEWSNVDVVEMCALFCQFSHNPEFGDPLEALYLFRFL